MKIIELLDLELAEGNKGMFKQKTIISAIFSSPKVSIERDGRLENSSGEWTGFNPPLTSGLQSARKGMSNAPESVLFVRRVLQSQEQHLGVNVSQTGERWFLLARHAAIPQGDDIVDRCAYSALLRGYV
jgi:hypothetical protein